jgi:transcription elongation factor Elf1
MTISETVNRATFKCPLCKEANLSRDGLVKHVAAKHPQGKAVCPICLVQPWGDSNYKTELNGHLQKRHMFDYDTTVVKVYLIQDYQNDEDAILQEILRKSKQEY